MKKLSLLLVATIGLMASAGVLPNVRNVRLTQLPSRCVVIAYDLDATAYVKVDIRTNGVSIGSANLKSLTGDFGLDVSAGTDKKIVWRPNRDWPEGGHIKEAIVTACVRAYPSKAPMDYFVLSLDGSKTREYYACEEDLPGGISNDVYRTTKMVFRKIQAAYRRFRAGASTWEPGYLARERVHSVTLTNDFYLAVFPLTQGQYKTVRQTGTAPASSAGDNLPADMLSGSTLGIHYASYKTVNDISVDANSFFSVLRLRTGISTLFTPTQAEWEFACRAGCDEPVYGGYSLGDVAWCADNSGGKLQPVGTKKPNVFGLYDMLGNVRERLRDSSARQPYTGEVIAPYDGTSSHGAYQCMGGGCFSSAAAEVRPASWVPGAQSDHNQSYAEPGYGVRVAMAID